MASVVHPQVASALRSTAGGLKRDLSYVLDSSDYYATSEIAREMDRIENGVNHMSLDSALLETSADWGRRFDSDALNQEKAEAAGRLNRAREFVADYSRKFAVPRVKDMQENQAREMHHWAKESLGLIKEDLDPYASSAQHRIHQFCDFIGVTDRYTGYRNNQTRGGRDPTKLGMAWLSGGSPTAPSAQQGGGVYLPASLPASKIGYKGVGSSSNPFSGGLVTRSSKPPMRCIQERCGINTTFPGTTEHARRYNKVYPPEKPTFFNVNPTPDFYLYKRPMSETPFVPKVTEYQARYEFPDGSAVVRKPWLRK